MTDPLANFPTINLCDFEFSQPDGERPDPVCMVVREYRTGKLLRLWRDELQRLDKPPFVIGPGSLFVAYYASAELSCFLSLGWPMPARILDLCAEFRCHTCGLTLPVGEDKKRHSLLCALTYHGLDALSSVEKSAMQQLAQREGEHSPAERSALLDYCQSDVDALARLLPAMLPNIDLPRAILRGRYMAAAARVESVGVPIDIEALATLRGSWDRIKGQLIATVDADHGVFAPTGQRVLNPGSRFGASVIEEAQAHELDPYRLADAVDAVWTEEKQSNHELFEARQAARRLTGLTHNRIAEWEDAGRDYTDWPGLDVQARELAGRYPALAIGQGYTSETSYDDTDHAGRLWDILRGRDENPKPRHHPEIVRRAAELLVTHPDGTRQPMTFSAERWAVYLTRKGIPWPRLPSGELAMDDGTFRQMSLAYPAEIGPIRELRHALSQLRLHDLAVGRDGRNRVLLGALGSRTSRNQPSNSRFIFGPSTWLRGLIRPEPGRAVAYVDYEQQEFGIGGALSGDTAMMDAYCSGDPYLTFAKQAGAVSVDATKQTHKPQRELFKVLALAVQYGMGAESLARRLDESPARGRELLRLHKETYPIYWRWSDAVEMTAMLSNQLHSTFGWTVHVGADANPRSLRNFPLQANGAEMLRLACILTTERGIRVCAPIHDALLVEGAADEIEMVVADTQAAMREASEIVLPGFPLRTDVKIVRYPERYMDPRGERFWDTVWGLIGTATEVSDCHQTQHGTVTERSMFCHQTQHTVPFLSTSLS